MDRQNGTAEACAPDFEQSGVIGLEERMLTEGLDFKHWKISPKTVRYENDRVHTISLYMRGGDNSYRHDQRLKRGGSGRLCIMPQGHESLWHLGNQLEFAHFYLSDLTLKRSAAYYFDMDVRMFELTDVVYAEDPILKKFFAQAVNTAAEMHALVLEQLKIELIGHLVKTYNAHPIKKEMVTGGLSSHQKKRLKNSIVEGLSTKLTIEELATEIGLSPYHFARTFKQSFGVPPAQFIAFARVERIKELLKTQASLSDISLQTGFSHQSHMTQSFKRQTRLTPAQYRQYLSV